MIPRLALICILVTALSGVLSAGVVTLIAPDRRPGKNIIFVVDVSGSMSGWQMASALAAFRTYAGQPIDDGQLKVIAFDGDVRELDWKPLPDANHVEAAERWLDLEQKDGKTLVVPALRAALRWEKDKPNLTVVLVSDGGFNAEDVCLIAASIKSLQTARPTPAVIGVIGVHSPTFDLPKLKACVMGGGYYVFTTDKPKEG